MQNIIQETIDSLSIGAAVEYGPMAMYPLLMRSDLASRSNLKYTNLEEVLRSEKAIIREVSGSGSVPELLFQNYSEWDILLVEGDHLVGAKQNRTLNLSWPCLNSKSNNPLDYSIGRKENLCQFYK